MKYEKTGYTNWKKGGENQTRVYSREDLDYIRFLIDTYFALYPPTNSTKTEKAYIGLKMEITSFYKALQNKDLGKDIVGTGLLLELYNHKYEHNSRTIAKIESVIRYLEFILEICIDEIICIITPSSTLKNTPIDEKTKANVKELEECIQKEQYKAAKKIRKEAYLTFFKNDDYYNLDYFNLAYFNIPYAQLLIQEGKFNYAKELLKSSIQTFALSKQSDHEISTKVQLCNLYWVLQENDSAEVLLEECTAYYEDTKDHIVLSNLYLKKAFIYENKKRYAGAIEWTKKAQAKGIILAQSTDTNLKQLGTEVIASADYNIGRYSMKSGSASTALFHLQKVERKGNTVSSGLRMNTLYFLGQVEFLENGTDSKWKGYIEESIALGKELKDYINVVDSAIFLANKTFHIYKEPLSAIEVLDTHCTKDIVKKLQKNYPRQFADYADALCRLQLRMHGQELIHTVKNSAQAVLEYAEDIPHSYGQDKAYVIDKVRKLLKDIASIEGNKEEEVIQSEELREMYTKMEKGARNEVQSNVLKERELKNRFESNEITLEEFTRLYRILISFYQTHTYIEHEASARLSFAQIRAQKGTHPDIIDEYKRVIAITEGTVYTQQEALAKYLYGCCCFSERKYDKALTLLKEAYELSKNNHHDLQELVLQMVTTTQRCIDVTQVQTLSYKDILEELHTKFAQCSTIGEKNTVLSDWYPRHETTLYSNIYHQKGLKIALYSESPTVLESVSQLSWLCDYIAIMTSGSEAAYFYLSNSKIIRSFYKANFTYLCDESLQLKDYSKIPRLPSIISDTQALGVLPVFLHEEIDYGNATILKQVQITIPCKQPKQRRVNTYKKAFNGLFSVKKGNVIQVMNDFEININQIKGDKSIVLTIAIVEAQFLSHTTVYPVITIQS